MATGKLIDKGAKSQTTAIGVWRTTKARLDKNRAPGQCYNGFICQLVDLWEELKQERINSRAGAPGNTRALR